MSENDWVTGKVNLTIESVNTKVIATADRNVGFGRQIRGFNHTITTNLLSDVGNNRGSFRIGGNI